MKYMKKLTGILLCLVLAVSMAACAGSGSKSAVMINFEGMARESVEQWMAENKISTDRIVYSYEYHETMNKDTVISQSPAAGEKIEDKNISFVLSNGPDPHAVITFIDFRGMKLEDVQKWFINEHFSRVSIEYVYDPTIPEGQFVGTNIKDGKARRSDQIIIQISANAEEAGVAVIVPDMSGWTRGKVEEWANTNKISVTYSEVRSTSVQAGYVLASEPAAGKEVFRKDGLKVTLSKGPQVTAIDLTKNTPEQIEAWGKENEIQISWILCYNSAAKDTIYRNEPNTGTMNPGGIMKVYKSAGAVPIENFTGKSYQTAFTPWFNQINQNYAGSANLKVTVTEKEVTDKDSGVILEQAPTGGTLNPGSTIAIVIARHVDPKPEPKPEPTPEPEPEPEPVTIEIPRMTGYAEFDFKHALHAYGVTEGTRTEQYSTVIAKDYIIQNDSGTFEPGAAINYTVSLGHFEIDGQEWTDKPYADLETYIESANHLGAGVTLSPSYIDTGEIEKDGLIIMLEGPMDDGSIHVRVMRYLENTDEDPEDRDPDPAPAPEEETVPAEDEHTPSGEETAPEETGKADEQTGAFFISRSALLGRCCLFRIRRM